MLLQLDLSSFITLSNILVLVLLGLVCLSPDKFHCCLATCYLSSCILFPLWPLSKLEPFFELKLLTEL